MMMQPAYASAAKTAEIMSRYRPIAPKPMDGGGATAVQGGSGSVDHGMSEKIQQSPYLRNLWPKLQARPTRTRKRGRVIGVSVVSAATFKRTSPPHAVGCRGPATAFLGLPPQFYAVSDGWFGRGFVTAASAVEKTAAGMGTTPVTLPLLPSSPAGWTERNEKGMIDLKSMVEMTPEEEKGLTLQLRGPAESSGSVKVISPRPIRPVGSCITVTSLTPVNATTPVTVFTKLKTPKEVEAEIEADELPAIVTDWRNRVRLTNSAYNEMVGQPKCMWLGGRIGGEVVFKTTMAVMDHGNGVAGFKGWVRIEWGSKEETNKTAMDAFCNVERLRSASKDYVFAWRFKAV